MTWRAFTPWPARGWRLDTVSGWLGHIFGKIPDVGEQKESNGYNITVLKKSDQNIESVKLELLINEEDAVDLH